MTELDAALSERVINARRRWWYAVQVEAGHEFETVEQLKQIVYIQDAYCPSFRTVVKSRHTKKKPVVSDTPLFRRWIFVQFTNLMRRWDCVLNCNRHVDGFMSIGGEPVPVRDHEIAMLRRECEAGVYNPKGVEGKLKKGDSVVIKYSDHDFRNVMNGQTGTFQKLATGSNSIIEITLFGRSTAVEIPTGLIERLF